MSVSARWLGFLAAGSLLLFVAFITAIAAADPLLVARTTVRRADIIVVLGGDGPPRAQHAAALFQEGFAPRVLVSGAGDCRSIRALMIAAGVPNEAIMVECASESTMENAAFSGPVLAAVGAHSALLVTSSFHTRRALACFRQAMPGIHWMSAPVEDSEPLRRLIWEHNGVQIANIAKEYLKLAYYAVRYFVRWPLKPAEAGECSCIDR
jgi:uncharacterized SAM-binding protein YcdF (DUF218 family)